MGRKWLAAAAVVLLMALAIARFLPGRSAPDTYQPAAASAGAGADWHNVNGDSDETGFSRLDQISATNLANLGLVWSLDLPGEASLEAAPVAAEGILYFTGSYAKVYAVDGSSGKVLWIFDPKTWEHNPSKMHFGFGANRGVAYDNGKIFFAALDGRLFALDAKSGRALWSVETTDPKNGQTITGAPRAFEGKVVVGQGGADFGMRGYVTAYDQQTGRRIWRFYVVPGSPEQNKGNAALEAAAKTWNGEFWKQGGGGGPWDSMTYDAELKRIYVGTANAYSYDAEARSPGGGDNLYTASIVALDADTGKYLWHYQVNPRDAWDYDATQQITLADLTIDGRLRRVLMQAPKNGFFYVLDRQTGKIISAGKLGKVTWAERIDLKTGRPIENPDIRYVHGPKVIFPSTSGAHSWMRMAFNPRTGLVYVPYMHLGTRFRRGAANDQELSVGGVNINAFTKDPGAKGALVAWDPVTQKERWRVPFGTIWNGGALATAGGLVFMGTGDGWLNAFDSRSGARLWRSYAGMGIIAAPTTFAVHGRQYLSVLAGYGGSAGILSDVMNVGWKYSGPRRLLTFALAGHQILPKSDGPTLSITPINVASEQLDPKAVQGGKRLFMACAACHGRNLVSAGGPAPDLRESSIPVDKEGFWSVVHDGELIRRGMPRFDNFTPSQVEDLRQYIRFGASQAQTNISRRASKGERPEFVAGTRPGAESR